MLQSANSDFLRYPVEIRIDPAMAARLHFKWLPDYARFLCENRISELSAEQLKLSAELQIPLLNYFAHLSPDQLVEFGKQGMARLLDALSSNTAIEYIESTVQNWVTNKIPEISRNQISPEDISLISFIRCKIFRDSLPYYTKDINLCICLMEEVNAFTSAMDNVSTRTLLTMQQELYEQAQQIAHIGNWSVEIATNSIEWSNELFRIYELEPQKTITYDLASFNHPDDAEFVREQMRISRETLQPHNFYYRIILKDGREKHLHARGQILADENGKAEKMFGTLQDVSTQKKIEREHRENELFIQKITELTPSLISVYNINSGKYLFVNQAVQMMLGYKAEDVFKKGVGFFADIVHPEDLPRIISENNKAVEEQNRMPKDSAIEEIREFRYRMRHADGHYKWFQTYGTVFERNVENKIETVINVTIDVNEQITSAGMLRQNAEEIRKQEDRYYKMTEEVEDYAILLLSPEGIIENWNTGAEKIKGYKSEEILGKNFRIFYTPEDLENKVPEKLIHEATVNGKASLEGWRVRKDRTRFWGNTVITSLHDNQGNVIGFSKVTRDLTQKKLAEDNLKIYTANLERKNLELDQKNKELESFSYIASHDLQEPIRKIRIWATRIEEAENISDEVRDSLSRITRACIQMQKLIQGVLQYSQTELLDLPRERTDLNMIVNEVLSDLSEVIEEKKIVFEMDRLPVLNVVRLQFVQLFSNIIGNAIKYSREGVIPIIKIRCALLNEVSAGIDAAFYEITISDNGIGFVQAYADKMFELFRRLESGPSYAGTGIGLAICKKIVNNHGGTITATGTPGEGASFRIRLPVS